MNRLLLGCILIAASWTASAADNALYKVELIVFENLDPDILQAEDWPDGPGAPPLDNVMELGKLPATSAPVNAPLPAEPVSGNAPDAPPPASSEAAPPTQAITGWRWLGKSEFSLDEVMRKLTASNRYRPLLHTGWVQPLDSSDQGTPVHIYEGLNPKKDRAPEATAQEQAILEPPAGMQSAATAKPEENAGATAATPKPDNEGRSAPETEVLAGKPTPVFDGTFTLRRGRFLHVDVDVGYRKTYLPEAAPPVDGALEPVTRYVRMTQSRRLRSDEVHYLDHPLFGIIFVVAPYQEDAADRTGK